MKDEEAFYRVSAKAQRRQQICFSAPAGNVTLVLNTPSIKIDNYDVQIEACEELEEEELAFKVQKLYFMLDADQ